MWVSARRACGRIGRSKVGELKKGGYPVARHVAASAHSHHVAYAMGVHARNDIPLRHGARRSRRRCHA